jgi:poly(beta-D-mannuronate) lyase
MSLTFETAAHATVQYEIDLSNNIDARGNVDAQDNPLGYSGDALYFKAGIYDQCNVKSTEGFWYAACAGTGDWKTDYANGDYAQATFSSLKVSNVND